MTVRALVLPLALLPIALLAAPGDTTPKPPTSQHAMADAADVKWGAGPDGLPRGAKAAVLWGDPGKAGPFVLRLKLPAGYRIGRHWHPGDELATVLEGDVHLDMGSGAGAHAHDFGPGGYALMPAKMEHAATSRGGAVVQISGVGPFRIHYVDAKDDPRTKAAAK